jgi:hypothetical protein
MIVMVVAVPAVCAALGLEGNLHFDEIRPETEEHVLNHMVGPNAEDLVPNFRGQMAVSQMPSKAHQLLRISVPDFDDDLRRGLDLQPPPVFQLQAISVCHRDGFRQVEKDILALICNQANAAAVTRIKI